MTLLARCWREEKSTKLRSVSHYLLICHITADQTCHVIDQTSQIMDQTVTLLIKLTLLMRKLIKLDLCTLEKAKSLNRLLCHII